RQGGLPRALRRAPGARAAAADARGRRPLRAPLDLAGERGGALRGAAALVPGPPRVARARPARRRARARRRRGRARAPPPLGEPGLARGLVDHPGRGAPRRRDAGGGARARALGGGRAGRGARPGGVGARARAAARRAHRPPGGALPPRAGAGARAGADRRPRRRARARAPLVDARRARARRRARLAALPRRGRARGDYGLGVEVFVIVHLLAACVWVGGAVALVVAGVPAIRVLEGEPRGR